MGKILLDKSSLPPGPWMDEPDRLEWDHKGISCLILRVHLGHLCGYVRVPKGHPYYGEGSSYLDEDCVHGGITFSKEDDEIPDMWRIGFDCGHAWDLIPAFLKSPYSIIFDDEQYRDISYVKAEVERLADQCKEAMNLKEMMKVYEKELKKLGD